MTLNGGFAAARGDKVSVEDRALIDAFIKTNGVTQCLPASAASNEAMRATNELVAQKRREFRANRRKAAAEKAAK